MTKLKTIKIAVYGPREAPTSEMEYRVLQVTDSTEFKPGEFIPFKHVNELCDAKYWKVTLVTPKT